MTNLPNGWHKLIGDRFGSDDDDGRRLTLYTSLRRYYFAYVYQSNIIKIKNNQTGKLPEELTQIQINSALRYPDLDKYWSWGSLYELLDLKKKASDWEDDIEFA